MKEIKIVLQHVYCENMSNPTTLLGKRISMDPEWGKGLFVCVNLLCEDTLFRNFLFFF